jgi:peptidyl-dipeptidase Dcp
MITPRRPAVPMSFRLGFLLCALALAACDSDRGAAPAALEWPPMPAGPVARACAPGESRIVFDRIEPPELLHALRVASRRAALRQAAIGNESAPPDFSNTLAALEEAGREVACIARLWYGLSAVNGDRFGPEARDTFAGLLDEHERRVFDDTTLFARIEQLHAGLPESADDAQQHRLIEESWRRFRRAGAHLDPQRREALRELDRRIEALDRSYRRARERATHRHELLIDDAGQLDGLPASLRTLARRTATDRGHAAGWAFTLHAHSFYPFMRHFPGREQRRELYLARMSRYRDVLRSDENLGRFIERLAELRAERAALLGFDSHIDYLLDDASLPGREALRGMLDALGAAARPAARSELGQLEALAAGDGLTDTLQPWDWWYYRQRAIEARGAPERNEDATTLEAAMDRMFALAGELWQLSFRPRPDLPAWHEDVTAWQAFDASGRPLGVLYLDPVHRVGKRGGAWTSQYRVQSSVEGRRVAPVLAIVTNFGPTGRNRQVRLDAEDRRTLYHEFGHALHALLSDVDHAALAGTNVPPDFVEFPALLFERWAFGPGERVPPEPTLGLETLELLAAIELDLAMHGAPAGEVPTLERAEARIRAALELPELLSPRHHGGGLSSLFASDRHGGDFRTLWSELLASDAGAAFRGREPIDRDAGRRLREEILSMGNAREPMRSWQAFRGRPPEIEHLLQSRGFEGSAEAGRPADQGAAKIPSGE